MKRLLVVPLLVFGSNLVTVGQDVSEQPPRPPSPPAKSTAPKADATSDINDKMKARYEKFAREMSGVRLIGTFTIDGQKGKLVEEEYTIDKVEKTGEGNLWTFTARIKYGKIDVPVPLTIPMEWAGDTPMVGISNFRIPLVGSGAFGARVIFYDGKYAGTWSHDKVGGHMFGRIEENKKEEDKKEKRE